MLSAVWQLMRFHRPVGTLLLLWPTLIALWMAGSGHPTIKNVIIFTLGVISMRAAGCIINDIADRNFDGYVARTKNRPLATKAVSLKLALGLFFGLLLFSLFLVCQTNQYTVFLAVIAAGLATLYPFMKRLTYWPQMMLGIAFAWAVPMAYSAELNHVPMVAWALFLATVLLTLAYDTLYAVVDKPDDLKIGIKSTAILFGRFDRLIVAICQSISLALFAVVGIQQGLGISYAMGLFVALMLILHQHWQMRTLAPHTFFQAFLNHQWVGGVIFLGTVLDYWL